ncbi:MAG: hypothetical protein JST92_15705 [Deltaproteobacteria bacterium]|nr:hypothetical protein [Deltaproteobacteria bacterium]
MTTARSQAERNCLARLVEMGDALDKMVKELPDDVVPLGQKARSRVAEWQIRIAQGGADLAQLTEAMTEISGMMDALTARLLLVPWDGQKAGTLKS